DSARRRARWALLLMDGEAVPALIDVWKSGDEELRREAGNVLVNVRAPEAAAAFLKHLDVPKNRLAALSALRRTSRLPAAALPRLVELLSDDDPEVRSGAAQAVGRIDHVELIAQPQLPTSAARRRAALALEPRLQEKNEDVRFWVVVGLTTLGQEAAPVW